ncbi:MAG: hypothetical protein HYZ68_06520 [Chloroflexi bacterium]|nr:hypothetical protein [Chloroflexota bacterium]
MSQSNNQTAMVGLIFLIIPWLFLLTVFLKFGLGVGYLYDPLDALLTDPRYSALNILAQMVVVFGPIVALLLNVISTAKTQVGVEEGSLVSTVTIRGSFFSIAVMGVSLFLIAIIVFYTITEKAAEAAIRQYLGG